MKKNIKSKIDEISKKFNAIEEVSQETGVLTEVVDDLDISQYTPAQIMKIENMVKDFEMNRKSLLEITRLGKLMLEKISQKLLLQDDVTIEDTEMFKTLSETVLNCTRASSMLYGEFSKVLVNIKKVNDTGSKHVTNNLNIKTENISTADLIEKLRSTN